MFFSLLVIAVAFLPVFTLVDQEGRLFKPLAYSKNLAMALAAVLGGDARPGDADALHRAWSPWQFRPRWLAARRQRGDRWAATIPRNGIPISRVLFAVYEPLCRCGAAASGRSRLVAAALIVATTVPVYLQARLRVHAAAERRGISLHADRASRACP